MTPPRVLFYVVTIALLLINTNATPGAAGVAFSYTGPTGPENWGSLTPDYSACSNGKRQSPIDISTQKAVLNKTMAPLLRLYNRTNTTLTSFGLNVGMEYGTDAGLLIEDGKNYTLKQMHWHSPSEHRINGVQFDAELHIVHSADDGSRVAVGLLYKFGKADPLLARMQDKLRELNREKCGKNEEAQIAVGMYSLEQLKRMTRTKTYYKYLGSLTTPPCSENVLWNILGRVRSISREQVEALKGPLNAGCKNNARPLQQLNDRTVELHVSWQPQKH